MALMRGGPERPSITGGSRTISKFFLRIDPCWNRSPRCPGGKRRIVGAGYGRSGPWGIAFESDPQATSCVQRTARNTKLKNRFLLPDLFTAFSYGAATIIRQHSELFRISWDVLQAPL